MQISELIAELEKIPSDEAEVYYSIHGKNMAINDILYAPQTDEGGNETIIEVQLTE